MRGRCAGDVGHERCHARVFANGGLHMQLHLGVARAQIGHQHGLDVVAEWVGNPAQVKVLAGLGVDYVQGEFVGPTGPRMEA